MVLALLLVPGVWKWRADARRYGRTAMLLSMLLAAQGFHAIEHITQWVQFHVLHWSARASSGILSPANAEWVHFVWNWLVLLVAVVLLLGGMRNMWAWLLLAWATAHTLEHTYMFVRHLQVLGELRELGVAGTHSGRSCRERVGYLVVPEPALLLAPWEGTEVMAKITFVGAGSTVFARNLLSDILSFPELQGSTISLFDIDAGRLGDSERVAHTLAETLGARPTIEATTNRRRALDGADYAICMIQVGGYKPSTVVDFEVPKKYGLRQTIADTLGIGGIMRGLRTIPVLLDICRDMEQLCPDATFLQYVNPMAINCWALSRASSIKTVGLCHSVFHTASELAYDLGVPVEEIDYHCAGINHMAFYTRFEHRGEDLYPRLRQIYDEGRAPAWNLVRYEMFRRLGYFVTESSEHFAEYTPYFIKRDRPDLLERFNIPLDEYIDRCERQIAGWEGMRPMLTSGDAGALARYEQEQHERKMADLAPRDPQKAGYLQQRWEAEHREGAAHSGEYGSLIIHAMETGQPRVIYGNVANHGLIDNLPAGCCVEVPCLVDHNGVQPTRVGALPPHLAALMQTNINVQSLTVEAALTGKREHIYHAAMLDPHTAAELDLDQIWALVDDLIEAHGDWLPAYS